MINVYCKKIEEVVEINKEYGMWTDERLLEIFRRYGYKLVIYIEQGRFNGFDTYEGFFIMNSKFVPDRTYITFEAYKRGEY
jgi:hypothetical protein